MLWPPRDQSVRPSIAMPCSPQPLFPLRQLVGRDGKRDVQRSVAVVRRNGAAGHVHGFERGAAAKQQQHAFAADVVGAKARIAGQRGELQHLLVEAGRTVEIVDVEAGLDHAVELGHRLTTC